jgi:hypothetical protein
LDVGRGDDGGAVEDVFRDGGVGSGFGVDEFVGDVGLNYT